MTAVIKSVFARGITLEDMTFHFTGEHVSPDYKDVNPLRVAQEHAKTAALIKEKRIADNPVLTLLSFDGHNIYLGQSTFGEYRTYRELVLAGDSPLQPSFDLCSLIIELVTADGQLVLGYRHGDHLSGRYLAPAGFNNFDATKDNLSTDRAVKGYFERKVAKELGEEVGLRVGDWWNGSEHPIKMTGFGTDTRDSFLTVLNFSVRTKLTSEEVQDAWHQAGSHDEHPHIIFIPNVAESITCFLGGKYTGTVNSCRNISYSKGVCRTGPNHLVGSSYELIENGVAGMLLGVNHHFGREMFTSVLGECRKSGREIVC
ncbi:MAG TPA: hypothetical protein VJB87_00860 [Candidatus Nanoarchaeia archaeon]|nr:hypothetical protein [Candidatus Nanoarchaeia archaeon]